MGRKRHGEYSQLEKVIRLSMTLRRFVYFPPIVHYEIVRTSPFGVALICMVPLVAIAGQAAHACTKATKFSPALCDSGLPAVTQVDFKENSVKFAYLTNPDGADCSSFALTKPMVRDFFSKAKIIRGRTAGSLIDWTNCQASGHLKLANGKSAAWMIYQFRIGSLTYANVKESEFYCEDCKANSVPPHEPPSELR